MLSNGMVWDSGPSGEVRPAPATMSAASRDWRVGAEIRNERTVVVWDLGSRRELKSRRFNERVTSLHFNSDGRQIVIAGTGGRLELWEWEAGEPRATGIEASGLGGVAFDTKGKRIAVAYGGSNPRAEIRNVQGPARTAVLRHEVEVNIAAFDPSGRYVVTASQDRSARVWDLDTLRTVAELKHDDEVWSVAFTPDGRYVASGGGRSDRSVRLWLWRPDDLIAEICGRVDRDLSQDEWRQYLGEEPYRRTCGGVHR